MYYYLVNDKSIRFSSRDTFHKDCVVCTTVIISYTVKARRILSCMCPYQTIKTTRLTMIYWLSRDDYAHGSETDKEFII